MFGFARCSHKNHERLEPGVRPETSAEITPQLVHTSATRQLQQEFDSSKSSRQLMMIRLTSGPVRGQRASTVTDCPAVASYEMKRDDLGLAVVVDLY